jgi:hypothetical protein
MTDTTTLAPTADSMAAVETQAIIMLAAMGALSIASFLSLLF